MLARRENAIVFCSSNAQQRERMEERWSRHNACLVPCCPWPVPTCWLRCQGARVVIVQVLYMYNSLSLSLQDAQRLDEPNKLRASSTRYVTSSHQ